MPDDTKKMTDDEKRIRTLQIADLKFENLTDDERTKYMQEMLGLVKGALLIVQLDQGPSDTVGMCIMNNSSHIMLRIGAVQAMTTSITKELAKNMPDHMIDRLLKQTLGKNDNKADNNLEELLGNPRLDLGKLLGNDPPIHDIKDDVKDLPAPSGRFNFNHDDD